MVSTSVQGLRSDAARKVRRTSLLFTSALIFVGSPAELFYRQLDVPSLSLRMLWASTLAGVGLVLSRVSERTYGILLHLAACASVVLFSLTTWRSGGFSSPDFQYLAPFPVLLMVIFQDEVGATVTTAAASLLAVAALGLAGDVPMPALADALSTTATFGILGLFGASTFRRLRRTELASQNARSEVLERLALSESRRTLSERLALLGQLAAGVAHELNNPFAYVRSNLNLLVGEKDLCSQTMDATEVKEVLADVRDWVDRLSEIIGDLKGFSSGGSDAVQDCDPTEVINDALRLASLKLGKSVEVHLTYDPDLPLLRVNRRKLSQVLLNLLVNAADALEEAKTPGPSIRIAVSHDGDSVKIAVQDNGPGTPTIAARLFEPFVTSKPIGKGTGLGLALSREYIQEFGGDLKLQAPGEAPGTCFAIRLPALSSVNRPEA